MIKKIGKVLKSYFICRSCIRNIFDTNKCDEILIVGQPAMGDVLISCTYVPYYLNKCDKNVLVICNKKQTFVLDKLGISQYLGVDEKQLELLRYGYAKNPLLSRFFSCLLKNNKIRILDATYFMKTWICYKIPSLSLIDAIRYASLDLTQEATLSYPHVEVKYRANELNYDDNSVIINPYSKSAQIPISFFEELTQKLQKLGYTVYCNIVGDQKPIQGSIPLSCTVDEFCIHSASVFAIISIRTGLLDYCLSYSRHVIAIYDTPLNVYSYSLKHWKTATPISEIIYGDNYATAKNVIDILNTY